MAVLIGWMCCTPSRCVGVSKNPPLPGVDASRNVSGEAHNEFPVVRMIWHGLNHFHSSLQGALQVAAGIELRRAGRFFTVMDTLVTLAPLLGLLGTVTGIMRSFGGVGGELAIEKVSGGIGEALIATAAGLGIAILALVPFNYFSSKLAELQFELETAATNVEVMVTSAKQKGFDTQIFRAANKAHTV